MISVLTSLALARGEALIGMIAGKYANIRNNPSVVNSRIVKQIYNGTAVQILDKTPEKMKVGTIEGHWYHIEIVEDGDRGWIFDHYVALEGDPEIPLFINSVLESLYYYRADIDNQLAEIKKTISKPQAFDHLKKYPPRFLNYIGYKLLSERDPLAFPLLIAFMDPATQDVSREDANYHFTWEILERLTPEALITNTYAGFRYWWNTHWGTAKINISSTELATIFRKIRDHENRQYRNITTPAAP